MSYSDVNSYYNNFVNYNWNAMPGYNPSFSWGTGSSTGSSSSGAEQKDKSALQKYYQQMDALQSRKKQIDENNINLSELAKKLEELKKGITDESGNVLSREAIDAQIKALENAKADEDGTIKIYDKELKDMTTSEIIKRGGMNLLEGFGNACKSLVGYDKNGKWNPVKCIINVGLAAGAIALFTSGILAPAGAALAASLGGGTAATAIGTAVASLPSILAATGLATGGYMATKGVVNAYEAKTVAEFDNATQDIGAGVFIGGSSFMGLKSMGNAAGLTGVAKYNPFAIGRAGMNTAAESMLAAAGENVLHNVNAAGNPTSVSLNNVNTSLWKYIGVGRKAVLKMPIEQARTKFESAVDKAKNDLRNQVAELDTKIQTAEAANDAKLVSVLKLKQENVLNNLNSLEDANNFATWKSVTSGNKSFIEQVKNYQSTLKNDGQVQINGTTFETADSAELEALISEISKSNKNIVKILSDLRTQRFASMKLMASHRSYSSDVDSFGFKNVTGWGWSGLKSRLSNCWNSFTGNYDTAFGLSKGIAWKGVSQALILADPAYLAYEVAGPTKYVTNIMTCFNSPHHASPDKALTQAEAAEYKTKLISMQKQFTDSEEAIKKEISALESSNKELMG